MRFAKEVELFGGSSTPDHGRFVYNHSIDTMPFITDKSFLTHINNVVKAYNIHYILPAHDSVVLKLAEYHHEGDLLCPVVTSPLETCQIARSKKKTMEVLKGIVRTPELYETIDQVTAFPIFLKPDVGQGSKGAVLAANREEALFYLSRTPGLLIFENLPGAEYTVDCYTNRSGELIFCGGRERRRISNGISVNTKPVMISEIQEIGLKINERLHFRGMWFFQLKRTKEGELALMEIAPRLAGTMGMYRNLGVNFALMTLYEIEGCNVAATPNRFDIEMDRALYPRFKTNIAYQHVYIDFDDCLLFREKINVSIVAFLYQCVNEGVRIHLITRHAGNVDEKLQNFRMNGLFDSVIHIKNGEKKSRHITHENSIFIDDSFVERYDVFSTLNIPVFAPDAIESLIKGSF